MLEGVNFAKDYKKYSYTKRIFIEKSIKNKKIIFIVYIFFNENSFNHTQKIVIILKMWNFKTLKIKRMFHNCFKISKLQESFTTYKWVMIYMMY